jgi:hypothetical protein
MWESVGRRTLRTVLDSHSDSNRFQTNELGRGVNRAGQTIRDLFFSFREKGGKHPIEQFAMEEAAFL